MKRVLHFGLPIMVFVFCGGCGLSIAPSVSAAEDLQMRAGVSFGQDIDNGFPIVAKKMDDVTVEPGRPALVFFGAAGDLNTNRQAKRLVELYRKELDRKESDRDLKFIVIDVDHPGNEDGKKLIRAHYKGYIPCQVLLDKDGRATWNQIGEVESSVVKKQIDRLK